MHFSIDRTVHTTAFDKPVVDHWLERKIAQTAAGSTEKDRSDDRPLQGGHSIDWATSRWKLQSYNTIRLSSVLWLTAGSSKGNAWQRKPWLCFVFRNPGSYFHSNKHFGGEKRYDQMSLIQSVSWKHCCPKNAHYERPDAWISCPLNILP